MEKDFLVGFSCCVINVSVFVISVSVLLLYFVIFGVVVVYILEKDINMIIIIKYYEKIVNEIIMLYS